jgi:acetate kinase
MRVLVLNAGSSTLKASVVDHPRREPVFATTLDWGADASRTAGRPDALARLLETLVVEGIPIGSIEAVGHRVVHGGELFGEPALIDDRMLTELDALAPLAPLHNPVAVEAIRSALAALPDVPHVAAFDTAVHATLDSPARRYALPADWTEPHGIRRFGFHGLSVEWAIRRAGELLERDPASVGLVVAHLGSGCSVTAVAGGRSVATSMGMTPLEGLVMGTRAGSVDPGILLRLLAAGLPAADLAEGLDHRSGLLALAGSADMRELLARAAAGDPAAALAVAMFVRRAAEGIAAAATSLRRLDAIVFTGGIGEHAAPIRERTVERLGVLGVLGPLADTVADAILTPPGASPAVLRVEAREDLVIAAAAARVAAQGSGSTTPTPGR